MGRSPKGHPVPRSASPPVLMAMVALVAILGAVGVTVAGQAMAARRRRWTARVARPPRGPCGSGTPPTRRPVVTLATARGIGQLYAAVPPHVDSSPQARRAPAARRPRPTRPGCASTPSAATPAGSTTRPGWSPTGCSPALATGLFTGVHVDIEPYTTPAWTTNRKAVIKKYLATLDPLRTRRRRHADRGGHPVLVRPDRRQRLDPGPRDHATHRCRRRDGLPQPRRRTRRHDRRWRRPRWRRAPARPAGADRPGDQLPRHRPDRGQADLPRP